MTIESWQHDPEFQALPEDRKLRIMSNYFDKEIVDDEFDYLPEQHKNRIKNNFLSSQNINIGAEGLGLPPAQPQPGQPPGLATPPETPPVPPDFGPEDPFAPEWKANVTPFTRPLADTSEEVAAELPYPAAGPAPETAQPQFGLEDPFAPERQARITPPTKPPDYGLREDGTPKGMGYFGPIKRPDGKVSTELSIGVNIDGKETLIPTLVPTLTADQRDYLINFEGRPQDLDPAIVDIAVAHARERIAAGKSPFAQPGEQTRPGAPKPTQELMELTPQPKAFEHLELGLPEADVSNVDPRLLSIFPEYAVRATRGITRPFLAPFKGTRFDTLAEMDKAIEYWRNLRGPEEERMGIPNIGIGPRPGSLIPQLESRPSVAATDILGDIVEGMAAVYGPIRLAHNAAGLLVQKLADPRISGMFTLTYARKFFRDVLQGMITGALLGEGEKEKTMADAALFGLFGALGYVGPFMESIKNSDLWRRATIRERGVIALTFEDVMAKHPEMTEKEILRKWNSDAFRQQAAQEMNRTFAPEQAQRAEPAEPGPPPGPEPGPTAGPPPPGPPPGPEPTRGLRTEPEVAAQPTGPPEPEPTAGIRTTPTEPPSEEYKPYTWGEDLAGKQVRSGSVTGEVIEELAKTIKVKTPSGMKVEVPKGKNLEVGTLAPAAPEATAEEVPEEIPSPPKKKKVPGVPEASEKDLDILDLKKVGEQNKQIKKRYPDLGPSQVKAYRESLSGLQSQREMDEWKRKRKEMAARPDRMVEVRGRPVRISYSDYGPAVHAVEPGYFPVSETGYRSYAGMWEGDLTPEMLEDTAKEKDKKLAKDIKEAKQIIQGKGRAATPGRQDVVGKVINLGMALKDMSDIWFAPEESRGEMIDLALKLAKKITQLPPLEEGKHHAWKPEDLEARKDEAKQLIPALEAAKKGDLKPLAQRKKYLPDVYKDLLPEEGQPAEKKPSAEKKPEGIPLKEISVQARAIREKTGQIVKIKKNAESALRDVDESLGIYQQLLDCLRS